MSVMSVSSRVVSRTPRSSSPRSSSPRSSSPRSATPRSATPRSSSPESSRSQSSHGKRAQTAKTSVSAPNKSAPKSVTKKTKSLPVPLAPASPPKNVRAKTPAAAKSTVKTPVAKRLAIAADATSDAASDAASATSVADKSNLNAPKAKRPRVPADFAERYGENRKDRKVTAALPVAEKKARKTAEQREKLRQLMTPDDDILQRLARAASGSSRPAPRPKKATRSKSEWESRCGKCGITTTFSTPAALCAKCGAIAVRVLD